uniref:E2 ubiquitin-conjugating enzyme n=2 Tax=Lactuca sativa TaxID=4236 RepID=A0A9R1WW49_LACSA|nr:hypothetical protein LSAT_V11C900495360 [Lactuca sativa]
MGSSVAERYISQISKYFSLSRSYKWALVCLGCVYICGFVRKRVFFKSSSASKVDNPSLKGMKKMHEQKNGSTSSKSTFSSLWLAKKFLSVKKLVKTHPLKKTSSGKITRIEDVTLNQDSRKIKKSSNVVGTSSNIKQHGNNEEVLRKYRKFKKFDIVEDYSDHYYKGSNSEKWQPPRNWAKKIQEEWRVLMELPDTIFVRVYESRMDLLRAVIKGAEGTPYHDGIFFFDICFPSDYPNVPPNVHYHSGGLRINPNLYENGRVCLSLLNTWSGGKNEKWRPGVSTMLQVLVSIQGLVLNAKPYFNEPGFAHSRGSANGEYQSMIYNESTLIYSLKTMVYTMKNPPKHFEDLVIGHFHDHAVTILTLCKGYIKGVEVGCCVNRGEKGANGLGKNVDRYMRKLVRAFTKIGVKNVKNFAS